VFTGGSLIVGAAARTDLVDPARTRELAHVQYHSLQRLIELPDPVEVWPTHGSGSFCSAPPGAQRTSTIGREKATNPLLAAPDADAFADQLIGGLGGYPAYFRHLVAVNRAGPAVLAADPVLGRLDVSGTRRALADGAVLVDVRPVADFAAGYIPGAVSIPLRGQFATWLGSVIDPATPVVIVRGPGQDPAEICWQALKIGYERLVGELDLDDWRTGNGRLVSLRLLHPAQVGVRPVLDVRQAAEYATGHLSGAINIELGDLSACAGDLDPDAPYAVMCGHGERASTAASLLARAGCTRSAVVSGGPNDWANATGRKLRKGP
jgi:rhodanese-related sulfurtransferase